MASNGNGVNGAMKVIGWIVGITAFMITIYSQFHVPVVNAIAEEKNCRQEADSTIRQEVNQKISEIKDQNNDLKIMLAEMRADIKYIKKGASN